MKRDIKAKVNKAIFSATIYEDGKCAPNADEILQQVGLKLLSPYLAKFYEYVTSLETSDFLKWVAYLNDITQIEARERVKRYFLIDGGIRMCHGQTEKIRVDELNTAQSYVSATEEVIFYTKQEIANMLDGEGFEITIHK
jgi:hypothetical protein